MTENEAGCSVEVLLSFAVLHFVPSKKTFSL